MLKFGAPAFNLGKRNGFTLDKGGGASQYASGPAPAGYRWDFVTENGNLVTDNNVPVVDLVRAA